VEKPSSDITFKTSQFSSQPNAPSPDGALRLRQEFQRGHVQVAAIFRSIAAFLPTTPTPKTDSVFGWGVNVSTGVKTFGKDNVILLLLPGTEFHGISRTHPDWELMQNQNHPRAWLLLPGGSRSCLSALLAEEFAFKCGLLLRRSEQYCLLRIGDSRDVQPRNVHWFEPDLEPYGSLNIGAEFLYGWAMEQNGLKANAPAFSSARSTACESRCRPVTDLGPFALALKKKIAPNGLTKLAIRKSHVGSHLSWITRMPRS